MSDNNTKMITAITPIEEDTIIFDADIENGVTYKNNTSKPEIKGILKNKKTPYDIEKDDKIKSIIGQFIVVLIVIILVSPFIICDLVFGYTDDSCVDIYPENFNAMNMKIYLLVSGYFAISIITIIIANCFISNGNEGDNIVIIAFLSIILHLSQVFLIIWNILGAVIFWGTLNKRNLCSKTVNNYLFLSLIIKLFINFCNIISTNNKK
jgi:hypothetical protein